MMQLTKFAKSMVYKVIITSTAMHQLNMYVDYTLFNLQNPLAAKAIISDLKKTKEKLSFVAGSLALCNHPILAKYGYRKIMFQKHQFYMLYRIDGNTVVVDGMYHSRQSQNYDNLFFIK